MPKLPLISGRKAVRALELANWEVVRQSGSHIIMIKPCSIYTLSIPDHQELGRGILRSLIRKAGLTTGEFIELLQE